MKLLVMLALFLALAGTSYASWDGPMTFAQNGQLAMGVGAIALTTLAVLFHAMK